MDAPIVAATLLGVTLAPVVILVFELLVILPERKVPGRLLRSFPSLLFAGMMLFFLGVNLPSFIAKSTLPAAWSPRIPAYSQEELVENGWTPLEALDNDRDLIDASYVQLGARREKILMFLPEGGESYGSRSMLHAAARIADAAGANLVGVNYGRRLEEKRSKFKSAAGLVDDANRVLQHVLKRFAVEEKDVILYGLSVGGAVVSGVECEQCTYVIDRSFHTLSRAGAWLVYRVISIAILFVVSTFIFMDGLIRLGGFEPYELSPHVYYWIIAGIGMFFGGRLPVLGHLLEGECADFLIMVPLWFYSLYQFAVLMPRSQLRRTIGFVPDWLFFRDLALAFCLIVAVTDVTSGVLELNGFEIHVTDNLIVKCNQGSRIVVIHAGWLDFIVPEHVNTASHLRSLEMLQRKCFSEIAMNTAHASLSGQGFEAGLKQLGKILS